ncbi:MAG: TM2 domain-containing protein [Patescibacteria group bacterium]
MENTTTISPKLRVVAFLLAIFFGMLGVHRFYVGKTGSGVAQLILTITFVGSFITAIWVIVDWIMILAGSFTDKDGKTLIKWSN